VHPEIPMINPMNNPIDLARINPPPFGRSLDSQGRRASDLEEKKLRGAQDLRNALLRWFSSS
jgi:hypothetical protein